MNAVEVRNLSFNYKGAFVFDNLSFNVKKGSFITIVGKGGSGKSTLFRIFVGELKYNGSILILDKSIKTSLENGNLGLISPDLYYFKNDIVIDELIENLRYEGIDLNKRVIDLSSKERIMVMFALQLLLKPKVLIIDNCFSFLDTEKEVIIREVKRVFKKCTVINITNEVDECLEGDEVIFLNDNITKKDIHLLDSDDFLANDLDVPFFVSLSEKLKFYGLTDKLYLNIERLIDDLWE